MNYPDNLPTEFRPAVDAVLSGLNYREGITVPKTIRALCDWSNETGNDEPFSVASLTAFHIHLSTIYAKTTADHKFQQLCKIGKKGPDLLLREHLFERYLDLRLEGEILSESWWPNIARLLLACIEFPDKLRTLKELDNYFRWRERSAGSDLPLTIKSLILNEKISQKTVYTRLKRLCIGLEMTFPGHRDLLALRRIQSNLYKELHKPADFIRSGPRRIPQVELLLDRLQQSREGKPYAKASVESQRASLNVLFDVLQREGMPFAVNRVTLDVFADHIFEQRSIHNNRCKVTVAELKADPSLTGWGPMTALTRCETMSLFIDDPELKRRWNGFTKLFANQAKGKIKIKERALSQNPMDMTALAARALELQRMADAEMSIQRRYTINTVLGALGVFLFYPLRKTDLLLLRVGYEIRRKNGGWILDLGFTSKTGTQVDPISLPDEASLFLDACILQGGQRSLLQNLYDERHGSPLLQSPCSSKSYDGSSFSTMFKKFVGHPPHTIRTIWCDELVARGERPETVRSALQHESLMSQKAYEFSAAKIRRLRAMEHQRKLVDDLG